MTVQEVYLLYKDNVVPENIFRQSVKNDRYCSSFVNVNNSTNDMISILKGKGILSEPEIAGKSFKKFSINEWNIKAPFHKNDSRLKDEEIKKFDNLIWNELINGAEYEFSKAGKKDWDKAYKKAGENLLKDQMYYINKLNGITPNKKRTDLPQEIKKDNHKDKDNQMKPSKKGDKMHKSGADKKKVSLKETIDYKARLAKMRARKGSSLKENDEDNLSVAGLLKSLLALPKSIIDHQKVRSLMKKKIQSGELQKDIDSGKIKKEEVIKILSDIGLKNDSFKEGVNEDNKFDYNNPKNKYKYYVVQVLPDGKAKIAEGFEIQEDAIARGKEIADEQGKKKDTSLKVLTVKGCKKYGVDPNNDGDWSDPKWLENKVESVIRKKIQEKIQLEYADHDEKDQYELIDEKYGTPEIRAILEKWDNLGFDLPGEAMNTILLSKNWDREYDVNEDPEAVQKVKAWRSAIIGKIRESKKPSIGLSKKQKSSIVKKAVHGKDIGKKGKGFEKIEKAAAKSGADNPKAVAAAAMWKNASKKLSEDSPVVQGHLKDLQSMTTMKPEELANRALTDKTLSKFKKQFAAKVLGQHIAKGNSNDIVKKAFQTLSDSSLNENKSTKNKK